MWFNIFYVQKFTCNSDMSNVGTTLNLCRLECVVMLHAHRCEPSTIFLQHRRMFARVSCRVSLPSTQRHYSLFSTWKYKLTYFDINYGKRFTSPTHNAGRGEAVRLAFRLSGIPFEDERVAQEEWLAKKESYAYLLLASPPALLLVDFLC